MRTFYELENNDCVEYVNNTFKYYDNIDVTKFNQSHRIVSFNNNTYKVLYSIFNKFAYIWKYYLKFNKSYMKEYLYDKCFIVRRFDGEFYKCDNIEEFEILMMTFDDEIKELYF